MTLDDDVEKLTETLNQCVARARALGLEHAVFLLSMAAMEIADRAIDSPGKRTPKRRAVRKST